MPILNDPLDKPNESFTVALSNAVTGAIGTPSSATVRITDDAAPRVSWRAPTSA
jgi:hypothetical protein